MQEEECVRCHLPLKNHYTDIPYPGFPSNSQFTGPFYEGCGFAKDIEKEAR